MHGSLCLHRGALYVGRHEKTARVRVYDLDGHERSGGFSFRDPRSGRSQVSGLAVDDDRQIWVADTPCSRVRAFSLFGAEVGGLGLPLDEPLVDPPEPCARGRARSPIDVAVAGDRDEGRLVVACAGEQRHAVQIFDLSGAFLRSLRPAGKAEGRFSRVRGVALLGRFLYVAESGRRRVQVFRDGDFHFAFMPTGSRGARLEPVAIAPLDDGRMVIACGGARGALLLVDGAGHTLRVLAGPGEGEGHVFHANDVTAELGASDADGRVAVMDRDGERVQVFTLAGRCHGAFAERA